MCMWSATHDIRRMSINQHMPSEPYFRCCSWCLDDGFTLGFLPFDAVSVTLFMISVRTAPFYFEWYSVGWSHILYAHQWSLARIIPAEAGYLICVVLKRT